MALFYINPTWINRSGCDSFCEESVRLDEISVIVHRILACCIYYTYTFTINLSHSCRQIYHSHRLYVIVLYSS